MSGVRKRGKMRPLTAYNTVFNQSALELIDSDSRGACQGSPVQPWPSSWIDDNGCGPASGDVAVRDRRWGWLSHEDIK